MIVNIGRNFVRDCVNGTTGSPCVIALGTGSQALVSGLTALRNEVSGLRVGATAGTWATGTAYELSFTADFGTDELSGNTIREFGVFTNSGATLFSDIALNNHTFNAALSSGADWYQSGGAGMSGAISTALSWDAGSSWRALPYSGITILSGAGQQISQSVNTFGKNYLKFAWFNGASVGSTAGSLVAEVRLAGSLLWSLGSVQLLASSGLEVVNLNSWSGTYDLVAGFYSAKDYIPNHTTYWVNYDYFFLGSYVGGSPVLSVDVIPGDGFTGNEEMTVNATFRVI